jgi:hypothetical protein
LPGVQLESGSVSTPAYVEQLSLNAAPDTFPNDPYAVPNIDVEPDVVTELWIDGGACATAWTIELLDPASLERELLDGKTNPQGDPGYASQNRFRVQLAGLRQRFPESYLQAVLAFPTMVIRAWWLVRIQPFERPRPSLTVEDADAIPLVEGCDIVLGLGNGFQEGFSGPCEGSVRELPAAPPIRVKRDAVATWRIGTWSTDALARTCGHLSENGFFEDTGACPPSPLGSRTFTLPSERGEWTVAISSCASEHGDSGANRLCGTWYANVEVQ